MKTTLRTAALVAVAMPAMALAQSPKSAPAKPAAELAPATINLANCAVARNAGDARWLAAIVGKRSKLAPGKERGAEASAVQSLLYGCAFQGADIPAVFRFVSAAIRFHSNAVSLPRRTDALADCVAAAVPKDALAFVEGLDAKVLAKDPAPAKDYPALLAKAGTRCAPELSKIGGTVQENEFYSRLNWVLRAAPALGEPASPPTQAAGR